MPLRPILSTLSRHKTAASLIVLEVALTCAIVCNAVFLIATRIERVERPSGLADQELVDLGTRHIGKARDLEARTREDLAALRAVPGVRDAGIVDIVPFGSSAHNDGVSLAPGQKSETMTVSSYQGDAGVVELLGLRLVAGRDFLPEEVQDEAAFDADPSPHLPAAIISRATAERLFPHQDALGKTIYMYNDAPTRVVGVVERFVRPHPDKGGIEDEYSAILPIRPNYNGGRYVLRVDPGRRDEVLRAAKAVLDADPRRVPQEFGALATQREDYYRTDRQLVWLLAGVCVAMLVVTAFGIVGLASFWVQQRTRMIGTRRALGATAGQIRRYFQLENLLLTTAGIALGMLGAYAVNRWLMTQYELPRLPALYLPAGALLLWVLGQVAVLAPARRASAVPPAWAMRGQT